MLRVAALQLARARLPAHTRPCYTATDARIPSPLLTSVPRLPDDDALSDATATVSAALIGPPNAGKSSLSNALVHHRVSAVSRKINTTRDRTIAVHTDGRRQLELWDTPGLVERAFLAPGPRTVRRAIRSDGWGAAADADVAVLVVDASRSPRSWSHVARVACQLVEVRRRAAGLPVGTESSDPEGNPVSSVTAAQVEEDAPRQMLVINKADLARPRTRLLEATDFFLEKIPNFEAYFGRPFMTSARTLRGVDDLRDALLDAATPAPFAYEPDSVHAEDDVSLVRQHIWEKLLHRVHQEVPYRCTLESEEMTTLPDGSLRISETIRAPTAGAVSMIIGPKGQTVEWIRSEAERGISEVLHRRVRLSVFVAQRKR